MTRSVPQGTKQARAKAAKVATGRTPRGRTPTGRTPTGRTPTGRTPTGRTPTLREERRLLRSGYRLLAGMDEVGRGALAGPVSVGVVVVDAGTRSAPAGVRDSKLLTPAARQMLEPRLRRWGVDRAVGHAEPWEIDRLGIIAALRLAGRRALAQLRVEPDCVLLDGSHDWLTEPGAGDPGAGTASLFDLDAELAVITQVRSGPSVVTRIKADQRCAAVACASVLAKVERDQLMVARAEQYPDYSWQENKGYAAPEHLAALRRLGPSPLHRQSWNLPVCPPTEQPALLPALGEGSVGGGAVGGDAVGGNAVGWAPGQPAR